MKITFHVNVNKENNYFYGMGNVFKILEKKIPLFRSFCKRAG